MDRRFEGLLFSLIIHALIVWFFFLWPTPPSPPRSERIEVSFDEPARKKPPREKAKTFVEETHINPKPIDEPKDTADFLSQFTKRVKKQLVARKDGPTRNSKINFLPNTKVDEQPIKKPGMPGVDNEKPANSPAPKEPGDIGLPVPGGSQAMHQVAIGPSSIAEYIPGVEVGDFTALNTDQFTYYAFFARINEQIRNRWVAAVRGYAASLSSQALAELAKSDRQTVVEIILDKDGSYEAKVVEMSSGNRALDDTTVNAFIAAAPFVNPPAGMVEDDHKIHLRYGFMVRFRPPFGSGGY